MQCPVRFCSSQGQWFTSIVDELPLQVLDGERVDGVHLQIAILLPGPPQGFPLLALLIEALDLGLVVAGGPLDIPLGTRPGIPRSIRKKKAMQQQRDAGNRKARCSAAVSQRHQPVDVLLVEVVELVAAVELDVLVGDLDSVVVDLRRQLRREDDLVLVLPLAAAPLPHRGRRRKPPLVPACPGKERRGRGGSGLGQGFPVRPQKRGGGGEKGEEEQVDAQPPWALGCSLS